MNSLCVLFSLSSFFITTNGLESHVFGGHELLPYNNKYLVKLETTIIKNNTHDGLAQCSGSIIGPNWILTAAHCFDENTKLIKVLHHNPVDNSMEAIAEAKPSGITSYPGYVQNDLSVENLEIDLALLKTLRPMKFNAYVQPIKMATSAPHHGQSGIIAGYGDREPGLPAPREGMVRVLLSDSCSHVKGTEMLCSYSERRYRKRRYSEVRAGSGDSGGPLVSKNKLVGVISAGCEDELVTRYCHSYYVNVAQHLRWIEKNMCK